MSFLLDGEAHDPCRIFYGQPAKHRCPLCSVGLLFTGLANDDDPSLPSPPASPLFDLLAHPQLDDAVAQGLFEYALRCWTVPRARRYYPSRLGFCMDEGARGRRLLQRLAEARDSSAGARSSGAAVVPASTLLERAFLTIVREQEARCRTIAATAGATGEGKEEEEERKGRTDGEAPLLLPLLLASLTGDLASRCASLENWLAELLRTGSALLKRGIATSDRCVSLWFPAPLWEGFTCSRFAPAFGPCLNPLSCRALMEAGKLCGAVSESGTIQLALIHSVRDVLVYSVSPPPPPPLPSPSPSPLGRMVKPWPWGEECIGFHPERLQRGRFNAAAWLVKAYGVGWSRSVVRKLFSDRSLYASSLDLGWEPAASASASASPTFPAPRHLCAASSVAFALACCRSPTVREACPDFDMDTTHATAAAHVTVRPDGAMVLPVTPFPISVLEGMIKALWRERFGDDVDGELE